MTFLFQGVREQKFLLLMSPGVLCRSMVVQILLSIPPTTIGWVLFNWPTF